MATMKHSHSFRLTSKQTIDELQSELIEMVHEPTGAQVIQIANKDPENVFCLSFQTIPESSNGVAHILEHTVLCGSKKFPVKDPFFAMSRRSLNTYLNALTGQDMTCYPGASQVEKDFYNLLDVYIDAVFHPELREVSFLQEGHRLSFTEPGNIESPLQYQGVVYNEMKGSMASPSRRLYAALFKHLMPDLTYAFNSGGEPCDIPSLTLKELKEFHRTFYHPSRCIFFFYGNLPIEKHLAFIEEHALRGVQKMAPLPPMPLQKRFSHPVVVSERYPIAAGTSPDKKTELVYAWLTAPIGSVQEVLALSLLDLIFMGTDASPVKMAMLQSGLCSQVDSTIDLDSSEVPWAVVCRGCDPTSAAALEECLRKVLKEAAESLTVEDIEASLHQLEFERTEINPDGGPFGLTLFFRAVLPKQHGCDVARGLYIHRLFGELREKLADPHYLPGLVQKWFLDNPHFVQLSMVPDPNLDKEEKEQEQERLKQVRAHLSEADLRHIAQKEKELADYQKVLEHQSLDCLPKLALSDVTPHDRKLDLQESKLADMPCFFHDCFTNQILYADLAIDLPEMAREDYPLLSLFAHLIPEMGAGGRDYADNLDYIQAYIGDFDANIACFVDHKDPSRLSPLFSLRGRALYRNSGKLFSLFSDVLQNLDLSDERRLSEWLQQHATEMQGQLISNSMRYAIRSSLSGISASAWLADQGSGMPYYQAVRRWSKEENVSALRKQLERIRDHLFAAHSRQLVIGCDAGHFRFLQQENFPSFAASGKGSAPWKAPTLQEVSSSACAIASPVAFTAWGFKTVNGNHPDAPYLLLAARLMNHEILHKEVREQGGAYGSGSTYSSTIGAYNFSSYRDPAILRTYGVFERALERSAKEPFLDSELEGAKFSALQGWDAPIAPSNRAATAYGWKRSGFTYEIRDAYRHKILGATPEDIRRAVANCLLPHHKEGVRVVYAGRELLQKEQVAWPVAECD